MGQSGSVESQPKSTPKNIPAGCPMHEAGAQPGVQPEPEAKEAPSKKSECPVNPQNNMPHLSQTPLSAHQSTALPTDRSTSSIPRPENTNNPEEYGRGKHWEYPSPQQFYNALVRKGWETPEESVEDMVAIHNFLNEEAWVEINKWEKRAGHVGDNDQDKVQLAQFSGRPGDYTPKARLQMLLSSVFPNKFYNEPPFDRHDWFVRRKNQSELVRYVIDYYGAPPTPDGMPVFHLDVRPALDSPSSIAERVRVGTARCWRTATGMSVDSISEL